MRKREFTQTSAQGGHKTLCVFTINYPFAKGEEFFESEIEYLKDRFDKIVIITQNEKDRQTREVPKNAEILRIPARPLPHGILRRTSLSEEIVRELGECFFRGPILGMKGRAAALAKFVAYGNRIFEAIENLRLNPDDERRQVFLYSYWFTAATLGMVLYKKRHPRVKAIARAHNFDLYEERYKERYLPMRQTLANGLDGVFVISEHGVSYLKRRLENAEHVRLSRLGTKNPKAENRPSKDGVFRIVSCSSIVPIKRLDILIDALARIDKFKIEWTHIGSGMEEKTIKELSMEKLGKKDNVSYRFLDHFDNLKVYAYYAENSVDCFVNVSDYEGIPVSIMEAASFGIPIIARNVGGVGEIVDDTDGILLKTEASSKETAFAIETIAAMDSDERLQRREGSRQMWAKRYSAEKNYNNFVQEVLSIGRGDNDNRAIQNI